MDNSAQIRQAATKLFASHGYGGVSLQSIADEVGVAKQTLLYHYPSKDALRRAVIEHVFEHWRKTLPQMLHAVTSGHGRFTALTEELIGFFLTDRDRARLICRELLDNPVDAARLISENLRPWILLVAEYVREGQRHDLIRKDVDPESYILHVIVLVVGNVAILTPITASLLAEGQSATEVEKRHLNELVRLTRMALFQR